MEWFMWLKVGINDGPLWTGWETVGLDKMRSVSWIAEELSTSQEEISAMELIVQLISHSVS